MLWTRACLRERGSLADIVADDERVVGLAFVLEREVDILEGIASLLDESSLSPEQVIRDLDARLRAEHQRGADDLPGRVRQGRLAGRRGSVDRVAGRGGRLGSPPRAAAVFLMPL